MERKGKVFFFENYGMEPEPDVYVFFFGYLHFNDIFDICMDIYTIMFNAFYYAYIYIYIFFFLLFAVLSPRSDISSSKLTYRVVAEIGDGILKRSPCWVSAKNGYLALVCTWLCVPKVDIVGFPLLALFLVCEVPVGLFKKGHHTTCYD